MSVWDASAEAIAAATGSPSPVVEQRPVAGGSINDTRLLILADGRRYFVKSHPAGSRYPGMFAAEARVIDLIAQTDTIRVPGLVACGPDYLVLEAFEPGEKARDWPEQLGHRLAAMHRATAQAAFGFETDNYLGTTLQPNGWTESWLAFFRDQRLGWQLELYGRHAGHDDPVIQLGDRLLARLEEFIGAVDEPAVLIHGDLWSGNAAADESGQPIIYDPAGYYGHREAEIGMMRLFGGFGPVCEAAYQEVWPFAPGVERRIALYRLYHELNHLNLFGRSYHETCVATLGSLL